MLWPSTLVFVTLFETLHGGEKDSQKETKDRMRFFSARSVLLVSPPPKVADTSSSFVGVFSWQFLPAVIFPGLTSIALLCLADNNNVVLRTLGSAYDGFGLLDFVSSDHCRQERH